MDLAAAATTLAGAECLLAGQVCSSLTRIVVSQSRHDELVEALAGTFAQVRVGDPFDAQTQMGPLVAERQRDRVEGYIAQGVAAGRHAGHGRGAPEGSRARVVHRTDRLRQRRQLVGDRAGGDLRAGAERDPGARTKQQAIAIANDTIYGLNASVFTNDVERARDVARQLRSGTVGHNAFRTDFGIAFGGFKQSGIGREGGTEGLLPFLETKTVILEGRPSAY